MKPQITTEPGALSVAAFCQWAGVSRAWTYEKLRDGGIRSVKPQGSAEETLTKIIVIGLIAAAVFWLVWELLNAPQCVCGRSDCGGGCGLR